MTESYVVVVGQIARDLVLHVPNLPGAGDTTPVCERREMLGGKGANIAVGLAQLGTPVALVGVVGDDLAGQRLLARAGADGIDTTPVVRRTGARTALIVDVVVDGTWRYLEDVPQPMLLTEHDIRQAEAVISGACAVVVQLQQPFPAAILAARIAKNGGARVVLDGSTDDRSILELADVIRTDHREAEQLAEMRVTDAESGLKAARRLLSKGPKLAVVAVDDIGNIFAWDGQFLTAPLGDETVIDSTGAGDAFVAALTHSLMHGDGPEKTAHRATIAAGKTVAHIGGRPDLGSASVDTGTQ